MKMGGNIFLKGSKPCSQENNPLVLSQFDPAIQLVEDGKGIQLQIAFDPSFWARSNSLVTTDLLGSTAVSKLPFRNPDDSHLTIDTDFFGKTRNKSNPSPGPFEQPGTGNLTLRLR
jgi:hypothetical protein